LHLLAPLVDVQARQLVLEARKHVPQVADDGHMRLDELRDLGWVDVDVYYRRVGGETTYLAGYAVVEAQPRSQDQVAVSDRLVGRHRPVHARHAKRALVAGRVGADSHQGGYHRDPGLLGEPGDRFRYDLPAAANHHHGALGAHDRLRRALHLFRVADHGGTVAGKVDLGVEAAVEERQLNVFRHVDEHRARPARRGDMERLGEHLRQLLDGLDEVVVFGDRTGDAEHVSFLEGVRADELGSHVSGDGH